MRATILQQQFPTFSRLLFRESRLRCLARSCCRPLLCAFAAFFSMTMMTYTSLSIYWHVWKTFEYVTPSQSIVMPISLMFSSFTGSYVGARIGLSRAVRILSVVTGLLVFCWAGTNSDWIWIAQFIPSYTRCPIGCYFWHSMAFRDANIAAYGGGFQLVAGWASLVLWSAVGLATATAFRVPQKTRTLRTVSEAVGMLVVACVLLGSIFYPAVCLEKQDAEQWAKQRDDLVERLWLHTAASHKKASTIAPRPESRRLTTEDLP